MNWGGYALERAEWQRVLFGTPNRADLLACDAHWPCATIRVRIHRNHGFEPVAGATAPYAAWNGLAFEWSLSAYDDSLMIDSQGDSQIELVWLDSARLTKIAPGAMGPWLVDRLRALRSATTNSIVAAIWPLTPADREIASGAAIPGVYVADLEPFAAKLGTRWLDARTESISGTRFSNRACLEMAREIACRWLPG